MRQTILFAFLLSGCAAAKLPTNVPPGEQDPVSVEAKFAGSEAGASQIAEFRFPKGSAALSNKGKERISTALREAEKSGVIDEVKLVAWADRDSAALKGDSLSEKDKALAERRLDSLRRALTSRVEKSKIETHNMAKSPDSLDRLFSSSDYRLKESLVSAGVAVEGKKGGEASMAGKGLVLFVIKNKRQ